MSSSFEEALERYPRIALTRLPTPLHTLPSLSTRFGFQVFIKRDDLIPSWYCNDALVTPGRDEASLLDAFALTSR